MYNKKPLTFIYIYIYNIIYAITCVHTLSQPHFWKSEDDTHTLELGTWESFGTPKVLEFNCRGQTPWLETFFISLESY
jgi:hypothetical protein